MHSLAIVIPAYKVAFLSQTLNSLVAQTNKNFNVYIGDDLSPDNIKEVVDLYKNKLNITFKRFEFNIGASDLAKQWQRCINLIKNEDWIWVLPDDDIISFNCVEIFYKIVKSDINKDKLYRFQSEHIDENGNLLKELPICPPLENNIDFLIDKLKFKRNSSVAEYIFASKEYLSVDGFVSLPLAWGSDDLLWIKLSQTNDIITLPEGKVGLRQSKNNISNNIKSYKNIKFDAKYIYLKILLSDSLLIKKLEKKYSITEFKKIISDHLFYEYKSYKLSFFNKRIFLFARKNQNLLGGSYCKNIYRLLRHQLSI